MNSMEYLDSFRRKKGDIALQKELLAELKNGIYSVKGVRFDGGRHGNRKSDISDLLIKLEERKEKILKEMDDLLAFQAKAENLVDQVKKENARRVLYYRFILGDKWEVVAEKSHIEARWAQRLAHSACDALDAMTEEPPRLPKEEP